MFKHFLLYLIHNVEQTFSAATITKYLINESRKLSKETSYNICR